MKFSSKTHAQSADRRHRNLDRCRKNVAAARQARIWDDNRVLSRVSKAGKGNPTHRLEALRTRNWEAWTRKIANREQELHRAEAGCS